VAAITDPAGHHGKAHTVTGPEAVTTADIAADVSAAIRDEVTAVVPPLSEALAGADPWVAGVVGGMFRRVQDGTFAEVTDAVEVSRARRRVRSRPSSSSTPTSGGPDDDPAGQVRRGSHPRCGERRVLLRPTRCRRTARRDADRSPLAA
jgi:hypothetical protein